MHKEQQEHLLANGWIPSLQSTTNKKLSLLFDEIHAKFDFKTVYMCILTMLQTTLNQSGGILVLYTLQGLGAVASDWSALCGGKTWLTTQTV